MKEHYLPDALVKPAKNLFDAPVKMTVLVGIPTSIVSALTGPIPSGARLAT